MNKKEYEEEFNILRNEFEACSPIFIAMGDSMRQHLMLEIAAAGMDGINVSELSGNSILSRPAVSHHLKVLKDAGLIVPMKKQTKIFYRVNLDMQLNKMISLLSDVRKFIDKTKTDSCATAEE